MGDDVSLIRDWAVLCEKVLVDAESGALTLVSCLEQLEARVFPSVKHGFAFAAKYRWDGALPAAVVELEYRWSRLSQTGEVESSLLIPGHWTPDMKSTRVYVNFEGIELKRPGVVFFRLDHRIAGRRWSLGHPLPLDILERA